MAFKKCFLIFLNYLHFHQDFFSGIFLSAVWCFWISSCASWCSLAVYLGFRKKDAVTEDLVCFPLAWQLSGWLIEPPVWGGLHELDWFLLAWACAGPRGLYATGVLYPGQAIPTLDVLAFLILHAPLADGFLDCELVLGCLWDLCEVG